MTATTTHEAPLRPTELLSLLTERPDTRVLDVRTGAEFETAHIAGSFNVPLDSLAEHARDLADVEHPVVIVCQSGQRAATAQAKLHAAGMPDLRVLDGGIGAWLATGGDVVRGRETWALERQVRGVAGTIVLAAIAASLVAPRARFLAGAVGAGLTFSALSNTCAMGTVLSKLPYNRGPEFDLDHVVASLRAATPAQQQA